LVQDGLVVTIKRQYKLV